MPANKTNYIVLWKNDPQVYGTSVKETALNSPPPNKKDWPIEDKRVFFITYRPDEETLSVHEIDRQEVIDADPTAQQDGGAS